MRHMLSIIVLVLGVAGLAGCSRPVHSEKWFERNVAAMKATRDRCNNLPVPQLMQLEKPHENSNCNNASSAYHAIQHARNQKMLRKWEQAGPYVLPPQPTPTVPPPGASGGH